MKIILLTLLSTIATLAANAVPPINATSSINAAAPINATSSINAAASINVNPPTNATASINVTSCPITATVYTSGGAAVARTGTAVVPKGRSILQINDLPKAIDLSTLRIKLSNSVTIIGVKTGTKSNRDELKTKIENLQQKLNLCDSLHKAGCVQRNVIKARLDLLTKNSDFGPQGLNDPNTQKAYDMYSKEFEKLKKNEYTVELELAKIVAHKDLCRQEIHKLESIPLEKQPYASIEIESKTEQKVNLKIDYRVSDVMWIPSYDMRAEQGDQNVDLVMKAKIRQNSGEDWKNIKMRLSTATQNYGFEAPQLINYFLDYTTNPPVEKIPKPRATGATSKSTTGAITGTIVCEDDNEPVVGATISNGANIVALSNANGQFSIISDNNPTRLSFKYAGMETAFKVCQANEDYIIKMKREARKAEFVSNAGDYDNMESLSFADTPQREVRRPTSAPVDVLNTTKIENVVAMELEIDGLSTIPSKMEPYSVDVCKYNLPIYYAYVTTPRVDMAAYLQMRVLGMNKLPLLDGELNMFFDNSLVNSSTLKTTQIADTTILGINRDTRISVRRDPINTEPMQQIVGQKWRAVRNWKYTVVNNTNELITVELSERVPVSINKEITVTTTSSLAATKSQNGIMTWVLNIKPSQSIEFDMGYEVLCPKNRTVTID